MDEIETERASRDRDSRRHRAAFHFLREVAELRFKEIVNKKSDWKNDYTDYLLENNGEDGQYLHEIFEAIGSEVEDLMTQDNECIRELSLILTKLQECTGWAVRIGEKKKHLYVLDRRRFKEIP